jgi:hypothetical protein
VGELRFVIALRVVAAVAASVVLVSTLMSAVKTFVVPRDEPTALTRIVFLIVRRPFWAVARRRDLATGHRIMRQFAPSALLVLPIVWISVVWLCFAVIFGALDSHDWRSALEISGSSVTSLGNFQPRGLGSTILSFGEAALGLGLVALLITYLPTIYAAYQRREREVSLLSVRAGTPPSAVEMLVRFQVIGGIRETTDLWTGWEEWFVDLEESHLSMGSLAHFRSGLANHSWVTASGAVLDAASLLLSSVEVDYEPRAALCIRSGFLALRHVADFFDIDHPVDPSPTDPISISREEFDQALARLDAAGLPLKADREQAWQDFRGWRVNYDNVLLSLCALVWAPPAPWSGDRAGTYQRPPITRRGGRGRRMRSST